MARWSIDPEGVYGVVTRTAEVAQAFQAENQEFVDNVMSAEQNCQSVIVGQALADFFTRHKDTVPGLMSRAAASLHGAVNATDAYVRGDQAMAIRAHQNAVIAPTVDIWGNITK